MIISVSGFGFSGASAVIDLLREYEDVQILNRQFEFQLIKAPDGLNDLYHFLVEDNSLLSSNAAIKRFKRMLKTNNYFSPSKKKMKEFKNVSFEFINSLDCVTWKGKSSFDPHDVKTFFQKSPFSFINRVFRKIFHKPLINSSSTRFYSHMSEDKFLNLTDKYICKLIKLLGYDPNGLIVLDQFFNACDPMQSTIFVKNWKMIVIDRDPRDIYLLSNYYYGINSTFMPVKCGIDNFVFYHSMTRRNKIEDERILTCHFEDLIFKYDDSVKKIENFLNINKHIFKNQYFMPDKSIANVGIFLKDLTHKKETDEIEKRLKSFCYNFTEDDINYIFVNENKKIFA